MHLKLNYDFNCCKTVFLKLTVLKGLKVISRNTTSLVELDLRSSTLPKLDAVNSRYRSSLQHLRTLCCLVLFSTFLLIPIRLDHVNKFLTAEDILVLAELLFYIRLPVESVGTLEMHHH